MTSLASLARSMLSSQYYSGKHSMLYIIDSLLSVRTKFKGRDGQTRCSFESLKLSCHGLARASVCNSRPKCSVII